MEGVKGTQNRNKVELAELFPLPPLIQQLWVHRNKLQKENEVFHAPNSKFPHWTGNPVPEEQNSDPQINLLHPYLGIG